MSRVALAVTVSTLVLFRLVRAAETSKYQSIIDGAISLGLPGVQAFVREGSATWSGTSGVASVEEKRAMTRSDRLRLASLTKMMTAAVALRLVQLGRFQLSDRVTTLLPKGTMEGIPHAEEMTVAHLLDHKSGVHNFNGENGGDFFAALYSDPQRGSRVWTAAELVAYAKNPAHRATARPGEKTSYSSTGYILLEMMMEAVEKKPLARLLREHLFDPLQMTSAGLEGADFTARAIVDSYARPASADSSGPSPFSGRERARPDGLVNLSAGLDHYNAWARGAGAVAASAEDLGKFMDAVTAGRIAVMTEQDSQFAKAKQKPRAYFDWNGGSRGIQATIMYEPARDLTVIVSTNASNAGPGSHEIAQRLREAAHDES